MTVQTAELQTPAPGSFVTVPAQEVTPSAAPEQQQAQPQGRTFTEAEVEAIRRQEKDKLYGSLNEERTQRQAFEAQVQDLVRQQQEREAAEAAARQAAEDAQRKREEAELDARTLLERREQEFNDRLQQTQQEWENKFQTMEQERQQREALLEKDRQMATLQAYVQQRLNEESNEIAPELHQFVGGNTQEEIEASIERVKATSQNLANAARTAMQTQRSQQRGVAPTGYAPTGPMEQEHGTRQLSADDIANMSMQDYAKLRGQMGIGGGGNNRGLYS